MNEGQSPKEVVTRFVDFINTQDVDGIINMLTPDHIFIDAGGGRADYEKLKTGWPGYFKLDPEYVIETGEMIAEGNTVVILGRSKGYYVIDGNPKPPYDEPTVWKAVVKGNKLSLWQVFSYGP